MSTNEPSIRVAVAQFSPGEDKSENAAAIVRFAADAAAGGADVLVAPEFAMFTASRLDSRAVAAAEPLDGPFIQELCRAAREHTIHLIVGIAEATGTSRLFNTLAAISPLDGVVAEYRKLHLYDAYGYRESDIVAPGDITEASVFTVSGVRIGLQTCYDLRFPEVSRRLADAGAGVLAMPAQWIPGPGKEDHWVTLLRARAIENTVYVAAADQCAPSGAGASMIIDPVGAVLAGAGDQPGIATAVVRLDRIGQVRTVNPALRARRFTVAPRVP